MDGGGPNLQVNIYIYFLNIYNSFKNNNTYIPFHNEIHVNLAEIKNERWSLWDY